MRLLAALAFAVVYVASEGCDSNCTRDVLNECTPAFRFDSDGSCFYLDLAGGQLWGHNKGVCDYNAPLNLSSGEAELLAFANNWTVVDNQLTYTSNEPCNPKRRVEEENWGNYTLVLEFVYAPTNTNPTLIWSYGPCSSLLILPTDYPTCQTGPDPAGSSRRNSASGRRNSASGRRNSASSRRNSASDNSNSVSSTASGPIANWLNKDNNNARRGGCEGTSPLFGLNVSTAPCQTGQCCGSNFCNRDRHFGDCMALGDGVTNPGFLVGHFCDDTTCKPVYPGTGAGAGGKDVSLGSSLANAAGALPPGGILEVFVKDANPGSGEVPNFNGQVLVSFEVNRRESAGATETIDGYLADGTWIEITVQSDALNGADIAVLRWDEQNSVWIDSAEDCAHTNTAVEIVVDGTTYTVPICHTSQFIITLSGDGDDKDDKKGAKVSKKAKPGKTVPKKDAATKGPKEVSKKGAKAKGKAGLAIGVGVAGAAVAVAGVGFFAARRRNAKKTKNAPASTTTSEVAIVSV